MLLGSVLEQLANRFSAAGASERESLRFWSVRTRRPFQSDVVKASWKGFSLRQTSKIWTFGLLGSRQCDGRWHA